MTNRKRKDELDMNPQPSREEFHAAELLPIVLTIALAAALGVLTGIALLGNDFINLIIGG